MVTPKNVQNVKQYINQHWAKTIREPSSQKETEMPMPFPFTVPSESAWYHIDVPGDNEPEGKMPALMGWTAGVFLAACEYLGQVVVQPSKP